MRVTPRLLVLIFVIGILGGVVGYAISTYVAKVYIEITQPAAVVKTYAVNIEAAPYEFIQRYGLEVAEVHQNSDKVSYTITVNTANLTRWKICLWAGYLTTKLYEGCATEISNIINMTIEKSKTLNGVFYVYATIYGKTTASKGSVTITITPKPLP